MFGVAIVQIPTAKSSSMNPLKEAHSRMYFPRSIDDLKHWGGAATKPLYKRSATYEGIEEDLMLENPHMNAVIGLAAALAACVVSALASVYFEKILKESTTSVSIWVRNVQLAFYSLFPALFIGVIFVDGESIAKSGFFVGYNWVVWTTIAFQAMGGIVVALCVYYADSIVKGIATSISILISLFASMLFFNFTLTLNVSRLCSMKRTSAHVRSFSSALAWSFSRHISTTATIDHDLLQSASTATRKQPSTPSLHDSGSSLSKHPQRLSRAKR